MVLARELEDGIIHGEWSAPPGARETFREYAGLPRMTSRSLSHSFGSHLLAIDVSVPFTRDALGHRELTTTNRYSHSIAPSREVFNRLDGIGKGKASATPRNQEEPGKENTK